MGQKSLLPASGSTEKLRSILTGFDESKSTCRLAARAARHPVIFMRHFKEVNEKLGMAKRRLWASDAQKEELQKEVDRLKDEIRIVYYQFGLR